METEYNICAKKCENLHLNLESLEKLNLKQTEELHQNNEIILKIKNDE